MTEKILQSCYTNANYAVGGNLSSGWQPVAVSKDIPKKAYNACLGFQNANSTIQKEMVDEQGNILNLFEIIGDGEYIYIIRTKYGLRDRLGRGNMFSHAFIFSWQEDNILDDPNYILAIDNSNFKDNEADAKKIPSALTRTFGFNIDTAMSAAGLENKEYLKLIQSVYTQISDKSTMGPLYIQYDGTQTQMSAILYCIYFGLPHYLRKVLCIASNTTDNDHKKNIVFSINTRDKGFYFIPASGENNILSGRNEKKIERYGFIDYYVKNIGSIDEINYFNQLDEKAAELGNITADDELILKVAHKIITGGDIKGYKDDELEEILSDALRSKTSKSELLEELIADMINEAIDRKIILTDETGENLEYKLSLATTSKLKNAGERYNIYLFSALSVSQAAKKLSDMDSHMFKNYVEELAKTDVGMEILNSYYIDIVLLQDDISWEKLNIVLDEIANITPKSEIEDKIGALAWELYSEELKTEVSVIDTYNSYISLMKRTVPAYEMSDCSNAAKEEYWECFKYSDFSLSKGDEYDLMKTSLTKSMMIVDLFNLFHEFSVEDNEFILSLQSFFSRNKENLNKKEKTELWNSIKKELSKEYSDIDFMMNRFHFAATVQSQDLMKKILDLHKFLLSYNYDDLLQCFNEISETTDEAELNIIQDEICDNIIEFCNNIESDENTAPLDLWLFMGSIKYKNGFYILDRYRPKILEDTVYKSKLLEQPEFIQYAKEYVQSKSSESKTVKRWLSELKKTSKSDRQDNNASEYENGEPGYNDDSLIKIKDNKSANIIGKFFGSIQNIIGSKKLKDETAQKEPGEIGKSRKRKK